jgi:YHS domain-containing protein
MKQLNFFTGISIIIFLFSVYCPAQNDGKLHSNNYRTDVSNKAVPRNKIKDLKFDKDMYLHALNGYDPVAYFTDNKAEKGSKDFTYNWMNTVWQFSSKDHLEKFKKDPQKYAPQFGGFSAYGVANGSLFHVDGTLWTIENGKLYLDVNQKSRDKFREDFKLYIKQAEKNWPKLSAGLK